MKKIMFMVMMMAMTITTNAMSHSAAKNEAQILSDKMAHELNLTNRQYDAVYKINLNYMKSIGGHNDAYDASWNRRNSDLQHVLTAYQYNKFVGRSYLYRPKTNGSTRGNPAIHQNSHHPSKKDKQLLAKNSNKSSQSSRRGK